MARSSGGYSNGMNIVCVKTGNAYSHIHVNRLFQMVSRYISSPFSFYCIYDWIHDYGLHPHIQLSHVDRKLDLESYWWKMCIFDGRFKGPTLYFDMDTIIKGPLNLPYNENKILSLYTGSDEYDAYPNAPTDFNSSMLYFDGDRHVDIYEKFMSDPERHMLTSVGVCRFLYKYRDRFDFLQPHKDYYSFWVKPPCIKKAKRIRYKNTEIFDYPDIPLVILNQTRAAGLLEESYDYFKEHFS